MTPRAKLVPSEYAVAATGYAFDPVSGRGDVSGVWVSPGPVLHSLPAAQPITRRHAEPDLHSSPYNHGRFPQ